jgi:hypothetical protein
MSKLTTTQPCRVHKTHLPASRINEKHHVFPQWLQALSPIEVTPSLANKTEVICSTGHNNVHAGLNEYITLGSWPVWLRDSQKYLATQAIYYCEMYGVDLAVARAHLHGGSE